MSHRSQPLIGGESPEPSTSDKTRKHFNLHAWVDDWRQFRQFLYVNAWPIVFVLGLGLRMFGFLRGRWFWLDESMLYQNLIDAPVLRVIGPLKQEQVVPPGFLMLLRGIHAVFGAAVIPLRFPAFLAGTAAFVLFAVWARKSLPRPVGWIAAWLMALNADALYYCQEMKPYAFDLLASVLLMILLDEQLRMTPEPTDVSPQRFAWWRFRAALCLFLFPWFSIAAVFPSAAFLAILALMFRKDRKTLVALAPAALVWGVSFLAAWTIEKSQVVKGSVLWNFWDFAFLKPLAPVDTMCVLADNLINPLHLLTSYSYPWLMFPWAIAITAVLGFGLTQQIMRMPWVAAFGALTTGLVAGASLGRAYPFHGRTIVVLLPFALTFFAFGIARVPIKSGRLRQALLIAALLAPTLSAFHIRPFSNNRLISFDGDLEHDHFTRRFGVMKRANALPDHLKPKK